MFEEPNQTLLMEKASTTTTTSATDTMTDALELQLPNEEEEEEKEKEGAGEEQEEELPREQGHNSKLSWHGIKVNLQHIRIIR